MCVPELPVLPSILVVPSADTVSGVESSACKSCCGTALADFGEKFLRAKWASYRSRVHDRISETVKYVDDIFARSGGDYMTNIIDYGYNHLQLLRLRLHPY